MANKKKEFDINYGGTDLGNWEEYVLPDEADGSLKRNHLARSCFHQPNHLKNSVVKQVVTHCDTSQSSRI